RRLQLNQTASHGVCHSLSSADDIHLGEDGFHVRFHCAFTNKEGRADLLVAVCSDTAASNFITVWPSTQTQLIDSLPARQRFALRSIAPIPPTPLSPWAYAHNES